MLTGTFLKNKRVYAARTSSGTSITEKVIRQARKPVPLLLFEASTVQQQQQ